MKKIKFFALVFTLLINVSAFAQIIDDYEAELVELLNNLRSAQNDGDRQSANNEFKTKLFEAIQLRGAFTYPFSQLTTVGSITSPDNAFRLFNWNVEDDEGNQQYFCYILVSDEKKGNRVIELVDNSMMLPPKPTEVLEPSMWYGALYYKIIPIVRSGKTIYTVLGWDGNNTVSTRKVIDVLTFTGTTVKLGAPIFRYPKETLKRVHFEFAKKATMFLNYEAEYNRIIFDHLAPEAPALKGLYSMYLPDLSHDAFILNDGKWHFVEDVVAINKKGNDYIELEYIDEKTGEMRKVKIKNKWQAPSESHVATTPEEDMRSRDNKNVPEKSKQEVLKDRKSPSSNIGGPVKKKRR